MKPIKVSLHIRDRLCPTFHRSLWNWLTAIPMASFIMLHVSRLHRLDLAVYTNSVRTSYFNQLFSYKHIGVRPCSFLHWVLRVSPIGLWRTSFVILHVSSLKGTWLLVWVRTNFLWPWEGQKVCYVFWQGLPLGVPKRWGGHWSYGHQLFQGPPTMSTPDFPYWRYGREYIPVFGYRNIILKLVAKRWGTFCLLYGHGIPISTVTNW